MTKVGTKTTSNVATRIEGVIFVPETIRSILTKNLQKGDNGFAPIHKLPRLRFAEKVGTKKEDLLCRKNPWVNLHCGRENCLPCQTEGGEGSCRRESIVYQIRCLTCLKVGVVAEYTVESSRTMYCRGQEIWQPWKERRRTFPCGSIAPLPTKVRSNPSP